MNNSRRNYPPPPSRRRKRFRKTRRRLKKAGRWGGQKIAQGTRKGWGATKGTAKWTGTQAKNLAKKKLAQRKLQKKYNFYKNQRMQTIAQKTSTPQERKIKTGKILSLNKKMGRIQKIASNQRINLKP